MADPLGLVTNLKLLDDAGEALTNFEVAVRLHRLVHALPGQNEVQRALHQSTVQAIDSRATQAGKARAAREVGCDNRCKYHEALAIKPLRCIAAQVGSGPDAASQLAIASRPR